MTTEKKSKIVTDRWHLYPPIQTLMFISWLVDEWIQAKKIIKWRQTVDICQSLGVIKHYLLLEIPFRAFKIISSLFCAFDWNVSNRINGTLFVAYVASVSSRVIARKLEREQKKKEGGGGRVPSLPSPSPFIPFFALVPVFSTNSRGTACYAGYVPYSRFSWIAWNRRKVPLSRSKALFAKGRNGWRVDNIDVKIFSLES